MSPDMLTLVAAVLAYDLAYDSVLEIGVLFLFASPSLLSRKERSETRVEKDILTVSQ